MHICSFTNMSIIELKKDRRNDDAVLSILKDNPRISTWDMSENRWLCDIIESLENKGLIMSLDEPYPWHKWELTELGESRINKQRD